MTDSKPPLIILIGPMGAGKTTIGKLLAQHFGLNFFDSDQEIERHTGAKISWIFEKEGEVGFRKRENRAIDQLTASGGRVLATGGGAVTIADNHALLKRGIVIYLRASVDTQYERTCRDRNRPLLQTADPKARLADLFAERDPLYRKLADIVVSTGQLSPKKMVQQIVLQLAEHGVSVEPRFCG